MKLCPLVPALLTVLALPIFGFVAPAPAQAQRKFQPGPVARLMTLGIDGSEDEFGGWSQHQLEATGRFRVAGWKGGHWLVTPAGHLFLAVGLCHSSLPAPGFRAKSSGNDPVRYVSEVLDWMRGTDFNTFSYDVPKGGEQVMNRIAELRLIPGFILRPDFPDLFDPRWRAAAATSISTQVRPQAQNRRVIGYALSQPLLFSPAMERPAIWRDGAIRRQTFLMAIKSLPVGAPGKRAYGDFQIGR